jgi:hypothetical protein
VILRIGGCVLLEPGANIFAFDVLFTIQPARETLLRSEAEYFFGRWA